VVFIETLTEKFVLKRTTVQPLRASQAALLTALYAHGVPVAVPKQTRKGEPYVRQGEEVFSLYPYLAGEVLTDHFAPGAEERARRFGIAVAQLHIGFKQCEQLVRVPEMDLLQNVTAASQVVGRLDAGERAGEIQTALLELNHGLSLINRELPVQLIHRDAHPANMLFLDGRLSGWLDFELIVRGPRLFDLCYCATSILMNGMDDPNKRSRWFTLLAALVEGYTSSNPLTLVERSSLWYVLLSIEVIFAAYLSHLKDEKGVVQNLDALLWIVAHRSRIEAVI
jgi:Ser/Thr protein kinase RdoA (MazF antagonist)